MIKTKEKKYILSLDIGGTKIGVGLINQFGKIVKLKKIATPKSTDSRQMQSFILKLIYQEWQDGIAKIGIGFAGQISWPDGKIINSPNIKSLIGVNLKKYLTSKLKIPVYIDNDVHCFTLAESVFGVGQKYNYVIGLAIGTGVGGGIVINNKIIRGADNSAGEFGHMKITTGGGKCSCGKMSHLESYISGQAMTSIFRQLSGKTADAFQIEKLYNRRNKHARKTFTIMSQYSAIGLANIINTLNPEIIVIGGGISRVKAIWKVTLKKYLPQYLFYQDLKNTKIVISQLQDQAIILGAALITTENY